MRKNYDFSKAQKNPYSKKMKDKKITVTPEVNLELKDIVKLEKMASPKKKLSEELKKLEKRIQKLESKIGAREGT